MLVLHSSVQPNKVTDHVKVYLINSKEIKIKVVLQPTVPIPTIQTQKKTELPSAVTKATNTPVQNCSVFFGGL